MVDHSGIFTWPGRLHDARVFHNSQNFLRGERGDLFDDRFTTISNTRVTVPVLGDPAYPLLPWLMKPFINSGSLTAEQQEFNIHLSKTQVIVEHAFGRLKGRWRCLRKKLSIEDVPDFVGSCCVLHNICQIHGDSFDDSWLDDSFNSDVSTAAPVQSHANICSADGNNIRRALMTYISDH
jgi:hypothetical protein